MEEVDVDLLTIAAVVGFADRSITRHRATGWTRHMAITVPVRDRQLWAKPAVSNALRVALEFLTGDRWSFEFMLRSPDHRLAQLSLLPPLNCSPVVIPFSGGLDSFAMLRQVEAQTHAILVTAKQGVPYDLLIGTSRKCGPLRIHRAIVPIQFARLRHAEPSYRTRAFVFQSLAGIAMRLSGASAMLIGENGQGSLGPALVTVGNEWPLRSAHPAFSARMAQFLSAVYGKPFAINHPNLWRTKGELLQDLEVKQQLAGWENTRSCVRNLPRLGKAERFIACGICGGCLLRRVATRSASLSPESHYWETLAENSLTERGDGTEQSRKNNDRDIAVHNIQSMHALAEFAGCSDNQALDQLVFETAAAVGLSSEDVRGRLRRLLQRHKEEWTQFARTFSSDSLIGQMIGLGSSHDPQLNHHH